MAHSSNGEKDDPLMKMYEAQAMTVKEEKLDQKDRELQQQRVELENDRQEMERLRLVNEQQRFDQAIAATERKFEEQLAEMRRQIETLTGVTTPLEDRIANFEDKINNKIDKENYQENMKNINVQLAEKGEIIGDIRQHFQTKIDDLQRRIDEQSGEIEKLRAGQLEKPNEETKKMMENMPIHLENISSELEFDSSVLVLGGCHDDFTDFTCIFDSNENKWRTCKKKLPFKVAYHGSAILNDKIYFMGGYNTLEEPVESCYKLRENVKWNKMAGMNETRAEISQSTIIFGSEIWVIGGSNSGTWLRMNKYDALKTVEKYNPQTNIWTKMPYLNFERSASSASIIGGKIFVSGGWDGTKGLKSVEVYDPAKKKWDIFCDMPHKLIGHCSIVEGTNLIIIGGEKSDGTSSDEVWKIDVLDPKKEWIKMPSLKQRRFSHGAVKLANGIMVFGGLINNKTRIDSVEIFNGINWKQGPKLPKREGAFSSFPLSIKTEKQLLVQLC